MKCLLLITCLLTLPIQAETRFTVRFTATVDQNPAYRPVDWEVWSLEQKGLIRKIADRWSWSDLLPAGHYRVRAVMNAVQREMTFSVEQEKQDFIVDFGGIA
ncbi:MAG: hypothetical protein KDI44_16330 [Thiothrix sp.]|nr:hypothetical protein [Thiothrix sp.]